MSYNQGERSSFLHPSRGFWHQDIFSDDGDKRPRGFNEDRNPTEFKRFRSNEGPHEGRNGGGGFSFDRRGDPRLSSSSSGDAFDRQSRPQNRYFDEPNSRGRGRDNYGNRNESNSFESRGDNRGFGRENRGSFGGGHGGEKRDFGGPNRDFGRDNQGFGGHNRGFGGEDRGFQENGGFRGENQGFRGAKRGFGGQNRDFGRDNRGFRGQNRGFGGEDRGFQENGGFRGENQGFRGEKRGFGGEERGFGGQNRGFGGDKRDFGGDNGGFGGGNRGFRGRGQGRGNFGGRGRGDRGGFNRPSSSNSLDSQSQSSVSPPLEEKWDDIVVAVDPNAFSEPNNNEAAPKPTEEELPLKIVKVEANATWSDSEGEVESPVDTSAGSEKDVEKMQ